MLNCARNTSRSKLSQSESVKPGRREAHLSATAHNKTPHSKPSGAKGSAVSQTFGGADSVFTIP